MHRAPAAFSRSPLLCPRQASRTLLSGLRADQYIPPIPPPAPARAGFSSPRRGKAEFTCDLLVSTGSEDVGLG